MPVKAENRRTRVGRGVRENKGEPADLVVGRDGLFRVLNAEGGGEDVPALLDGVLDLAGDEEAGEGGVLVVVVGVAEGEAELVEVDGGGVEGADGQAEAGADLVDELDALEARGGLAAGVRGVGALLPADGELGAVLGRGDDEAGVRSRRGR